MGNPLSIHPQGRNTLCTDAVSAAICAAIPAHPSIKAACHACGFSMGTVANWVRRGSLPGANPAMTRFALDFAAAVAAHGKERKAAFERLADEGSPGATQVLRYMRHRNMMDDSEADVETMLTSSSKKSDSLEQLLLHPTPRLLGLLARCGWSRPPDWSNSEHILTTGESAPEF